MRSSTLTLGIVYLAMIPFCLMTSPGVRPTYVGFALMGLLAVAGVLVIFRQRSGFYLGMVAGALTTIAGILTWAHIGGDRITMPMDARVEAVLGIYLCFRTALSENKFGPPKPRRRLSDELDLDEA